jgi:drug/metabolite transporter (DMT)-like permease
MPDKRKTLILLCYLTLYLVWGSTYFTIKMAVESIPPYYVVGLRFAGGGVLLLAIALLGGRLKARPTPRELLASFALGALLLLGGAGLITAAEQVVDSYIVALIVAATPMLVAFFDRVLLRKRLSAVRLAGIGVGIVGVAFLLYNGHSMSASLSPQIGMVIGGVGCWGLATSLGHRLRTCPDPLVNSGVQMLFVGVVALIGVSFLYPPLPQILPAVSLRSGLGLLYLSVVGSLAFGAYTYLIAHEPAIRVVSYSLVNPLIATLLGLLVGQETPAPLLALGLPLILIGVALMLYGETALPHLRRRLVRAPGITEATDGR